MKAKILYISIAFLFISTASFAQDKKKAPLSIISRTAIIKKYYDKNELSSLPKGELIELCVERVAVLAKTLPYISLATKPGITLEDFGIPKTSEYRKAFEGQEENTKEYLDNTAEYQKKILPYGDKDDLIKAILFYENILKSLHEFDDM
ncbi:hypothetical protein C3L50_08605 [Flavobacterium alvei]|jgi:hypothetical protein|uniref:Uncharacterized protein n=1 Tax=Flavobacterium alvei TaxID=2080416 RepID=A0A2S5ABB3_9FLAO|nr:hypothetical protein [Flavobacterium alvei]POY39881.1 hypothetical protein C3L50_08605 [Flavobacterium alvei]HQE34198.1 hypothetical protein [Flavobacterium alvei]HQK39228.1 hypothetical protein [Flavobacterium alvei]